MLERKSITKETINTFLRDNLNSYIEKLIKEDFKDESDRSTGIREYLNLMLDMPNNINIPSVIEDLSREDLEELKLEFDIIDSEESDFQTVESVIDLLLTIGLLEIQPFISNETKTYNIFLSHCSWDAREVFGLKLLLEKEYKKIAYVDWIDDKQSNFPRAVKKVIDTIKEIVTKDYFERIDEFYRRIKLFKDKDNIENELFISDLIIKRLSNSNSLFYVQSRHYDHSRWMPYEIGLAESSNKDIYRLPIKYVRARKKFGKRSGFLERYPSILNKNQEFKSKKMNKI